MAEEDTGSAQKGFKIFKELIYNCQDHIGPYTEKLSALLLQGVDTKNTPKVHNYTLMVRYFELACHLSCISKQIYE